MKVVQAGHHLVEIGASDFLWELAGVAYVVEQLSASTVLKDDGKTLVSGPVFSLVSGHVSDSDKLDDVFLIEVFHDSQLINERLKVGCFRLVSLDGYQLSLGVFGQFDPKLKEITYTALYPEPRVLMILNSSK